MKKALNTKNTSKKEIDFLNKKKWLAKFFGTTKAFGDGLAYQRKMRYGKV